MDDHDNGSTYSDMLLAIGARLDTQGCHDVVLAEVADGFVGCASHAGTELTMESLAYGFEELRQDTVSAQDRHGGGGTHYRTLLGALGREFDRVGGRMIVVMELSIGVLVTYYPVAYHLEGCYGDRYEILYKQDQLRDLQSLAGVQ